MCELVGGQRVSLRCVQVQLCGPDTGRNSQHPSQLLVTLKESVEAVQYDELSSDNIERTMSVFL